MIASLLQLLPSDDSVAPSAPAVDQISVPKIDWGYMAPILILMIGSLVWLLLIALFRKQLRPIASIGTCAIALASIVSTIPIWNRVGNPAEGPISAVAGAVGIDRFSLFVTMLLSLAVILASLLSDDYLKREGLDLPELHVLLLLAASGGAIMASANDLIVMFIGIEVLSIATYVMAASHARRVSSQEAGFKYFVLGAFASAFLLYGIAMIYGATGSTSLLEIQSFLSETVLTDNGLILAGLALLLVGFGFKVSAAPFHMWAPDVYQGAPSPVSAFMASGVKVGAFAGMLRIFVVTFPSYGDFWKPAVFAIAVLSLVIGAVLAVIQTNVKRMLAYSSIAHAGFILVAVEAGTDKGISAALFYLFAYTAMAAGSFGVVSIVGRTGDGAHNLSDYKGLGKAQPGLALVFTLLLMAQAGVPLTGGFMAKFNVISASVDTSNWVLAIIAMVSSVISAFLYLRIIVAMHFEDADEAAEKSISGIKMGWASRSALGIAVVLTLFLGLYPQPAAEMTNDAVAELVAVAPGG